MDRFNAYMEIIFERKTDPYVLVSKEGERIKVRQKDVESPNTCECMYLPHSTSVLQEIVPSCFVYAETIWRSNKLYTTSFNCIIPIEKGHFVEVYVYTVLDGKPIASIRPDACILNAERIWSKGQVDTVPHDILEKLKNTLKREMMNRNEYRLLHATGLLN